MIVSLPTWDVHLPGPWERPLVPPANEIGYEFYVCDRISLGEFERGPVLLGYEWHSIFTLPDSCVKNGTTLHWVLYTLWTNSTELATALNATHAMKVVVAEYEEIRTDVGAGAKQVTARARLPGSTEYALEMHWNEPPSETQSLDQRHRLFWFEGDRVHALDLFLNSTGQAVNDVEASYGKLRSPTLYATSGIEDFVGRTFPDQAASQDGRFYEYEDLLCMKPVEEDHDEGH